MQKKIPKFFYLYRRKPKKCFVSNKENPSKEKARKVPILNIFFLCHQLKQKQLIYLANKLGLAYTQVKLRDSYNRDTERKHNEKFLFSKNNQNLRKGFYVLLRTIGRICERVCVFFHFWRERMILRFDLNFCEVIWTHDRGSHNTILGSGGTSYPTYMEPLVPIFGFFSL